VPFQLIPAGTHIDFISKRQICAAISSVLIVVPLILVLTGIRPIKLGIDFAGGSEVLVQFDAGVTSDEGLIREVLKLHPEIQDPTVVRFGDAAENEFQIRFAGGSLDVDQDAQEVADEIVDEAEDTGGVPDKVQGLVALLQRDIGPLTVQRVEFVGPRVGKELQTDGLLSLFWASLAILAYVAVRFSSRFAPGAVVAVVHDLLITAGLFVMLGLEFDLRVLAAMLAILGYSLNDTIIIYDRIRENLELRTSRDLPAVLNLSINQTLSRTVLTSGTTLLALFSLYFLGGEVIRPFAFAMLVGVIVGTYSSIYIASPLLLILEKWLGVEPPKRKKQGPNVAARV
jgi:preprotein translocase subunit SecF